MSRPTPTRKEDLMFKAGYYSMHQAAKMLGISTKSLHERVRRGTVKVERVPDSGWLWVHNTELNKAKEKEPIHGRKP